ncbi:MAG: indole-3-glycerol phosphate synthase TrpC [Sarcina sp.]
MILDKICKYKKLELERRKVELKLENIKAILKLKREGKPKFKEAIRKEGLTIIGEAKKASPSKGLIKPDFDIEKIVKYYDKSEVRCISILTESNYFQGNIDNLTIARGITEKPLLRKDFIVDEYQLYESKMYGADAVLLIVAVLQEKLGCFYKLAKSLNLDVLVEVHDQEELEVALECNVEIIGINNRDLKTFEVDIKNTEKLKAKIKNDEILVVSESGISSEEDIEYIDRIGADAVLIGEYFMRSGDFESTI